MKIYQLPDDLMEGAPRQDNDIIIRLYNAGINSIKNKIMLNCNMINLVLKGAKTVVYPEQTAIIHQGELVLLSTGNMLTSELISDGGIFNSILLYFSNETLSSFMIKYRHLLTQPIAPRSAQSFLIYQQDAFIDHFIQSLQFLLASPAALTPEIRQLKIEELLLYLLRQDAARFQSLKMGTHIEVDNQLKIAVQNHIGQSVTVEELAFLCNMSVSTFKRKFDRLYGTSPQKWLLKQRLERAAELLRSADEMPSDVYHQVGYLNHSSFSEAFRQHFGLTPSDYRTQHLNAWR